VTGKPDDAAPAEVLRAKRLEIVDDEGKVRAVLGTREEGIGGCRSSMRAGESELV